MVYSAGVSSDICGFCNNLFTVSKHQFYRKKKNPNKKLFCSTACYTKYKKGKGNPNWRGGKRLNDGYVYIYNPSHPRATTAGVVLEHRLVMEKHIGRYLLPTESVHHIDENTMNNCIDNLVLFPTEAAHRAHHSLTAGRDNLGKWIKKEDSKNVILDSL